MPEHPFRLTKRQIVLVILAVVWAGAVAIDASYLFGRARGNNDVIAGLSRGGRLMNVLIPAQAGRGERMISIYRDGSAHYWSPQDTGIFATVSEYLPITFAEWQAVETLRLQWCQAPPQYSLANVKSVYEVGLLCPSLFPKREQLPVEMMPSALATLITRALLK
jgi:hypothetical protein